MNQKQRCFWVTGESELYLKYHDEEWGVPLYGDNEFFERISLEGAQAGLSWITILKRRENYNRAFDNFDIEKVARYNEKDIERLVLDAGIIRNRAKIKSVINNAQKTIEIIEKHGSFTEFLWQFVDGTPIHNTWTEKEQVPAITNESKEMSKALKEAGFAFVGPTICYAMMQATGMVNDHMVDCYRYQEIKDLS